MSFSSKSSQISCAYHHKQSYWPWKNRCYQKLGKTCIDAGINKLYGVCILLQKIYKLLVHRRTPRESCIKNLYSRCKVKRNHKVLWNAEINQSFEKLKSNFLLLLFRVAQTRRIVLFWTRMLLNSALELFYHKRIRVEKSSKQSRNKILCYSEGTFGTGMEWSCTTPF